ncbi:phage portal protein [Jatrophihabitans sp.]|uniref:phage portal protein n=1 Tax=Jatrophihabitans sp. TaxID=1932789 RepID=UPI0030C65CC7|nr:23, phiSA1p03 [Jatrophihabitans sp.]
MATAKEALAWVDKLHSVLSKRKLEIEKAFEYFEGDQPLAYASPQWKQFHADRYKGFSDNWCGVVGRVPVDRQEIIGFRLGTPTDVVTDDEKQLWADWNRNELGAQSNQGFLSSTIAKRSAVLVWGDDNDEPEVTWEHPSQVVVAYAPANQRVRLAALKVWTEADVQYATLYLPNEVWKWQRGTFGMVTNGRTEGGLYVAGDYAGGGGWVPREVVNEVWPLPNPLGVVPIVEWTNRPMLGGEPISDIQGTMAMQDAINMLWAYLFTAADHASMPARVVLGAEPPKIPILDEQGQIIGSKPAKLEDLANGRLLFLPGAAGNKATIDQWDAAKLDVFTGVVKPAIGHVAAQTSTPGYYLLTNEAFANLNGDALTAADVPLVDKVNNQRLHFNPASKETAALMALVRGRKDLAASIRASDGNRFTQWKNAAMHSPSQIADAATKDKSIGMSLRTVLERRYGMTEPEIDREFDRIRAEQADPFALLDVGTRAAMKGTNGADTSTAGA